MATSSEQRKEQPAVAAWTPSASEENNSGRFPTGAARFANWIIVGISVLNLLVVVGTMLMLATLGFPRFGVSLIDKIVLGLGALSALLRIVLISIRQV